MSAVAWTAVPIPVDGGGRPEQAMADYRLDYLNRRQRVTRTRALNCSGDDEAIDRAALVSHAGALELWRGAEKVWRFEPRGWRTSPANPDNTGDTPEEGSR
jgi:hypothetical protein